MQSPSFITTSGVRQGCVLALALFCRAIDWIMERVVSTIVYSLGNDHFTDLDYADDVALLAHTVDHLHTSLDILETTASKLGIHVSWQKTKIQNLGVGDSNISNLSVSDTQWKKLLSSHIWALFCPPLVGANQIYSDGSALLLPPCTL